MKRTGKEILRFLQTARIDYLTSTYKLTRYEKRDCYRRIVRTVFLLLWGNISSPFIYPIWYFFRVKITERIYRGTSWEEINNMVSANETKEAKEILKSNGRFLYWLWTYGDINDPLGRGGMPDDWNKFRKNNFWNRFKWSAIRNCRYNINYMELRSSDIIQIVKVKDTQRYDIMHVSGGIGDSPYGIVFLWIKDKYGDWYLYYEDNSSNCIFWFGWVGWKYKKTGLRFELSYRVTERSYFL